MGGKTIRLPLNNAVTHYFSSDNYSDITDEFLEPLDLLYTFCFRYPRLLTVDLGHSADSQGAAIDVTAGSTEAALATTILFSIVALSNAIRVYRNQKEAAAKKLKKYHAERLQAQQFFKQNALENNIHKASRTKPRLSIPQEYQEYAERRRRERMNQHLEEILKEKDHELRKKYQAIKIDKDNHIHLTLVEEEQNLLKKMGRKLWALASASWVTLAICSYAYWILWIGTGVFTGQFSNAGVYGLGGAGFAIPMAAAAVYPFLKLRDWIRGKKNQTEPNKQIEENPELVIAAAQDAARLLNEVMFAEKKQRLYDEIQSLKDRNLVFSPLPTSTFDKRMADHGNDSALSQSIWTKSFTAFFAKLSCSFILAQYGSWIITDLIKSIAHVTLDALGFSTGLGSIFMLGSIVFGAYKAYQRYQEIKKQKIETKRTEHEINEYKDKLEISYAKKQNEMLRLNNSIRALAKGYPDLAKKYAELVIVKDSVKEVQPEKVSVNPRPMDKWKSHAKSACVYVYKFLTGAMSGAFLARMFTISGTAIFLPFAAAALANPYTGGLIIAAGIAYGLFKVYQYYQDKKEAEVKAFQEKRADRIKFLGQNSDVADLEINLLKAKEHFLKQKAVYFPRRHSIDSADMSEVSINLSMNTMFHKKNESVVDEVAHAQFSQGYAN